MPRNNQPGRADKVACTPSCRDERAGEEGAALSSRQASVKGAVIRLTTGRGSGGSTDEGATAAPRMIATDLATVRTAVAIWDTRNNSRSTQLGARGMVGVERGR